MTDADKSREALRLLIDAILDAVAAAGPMGAPGGHLYAALMGHMGISTFNAIMSAMVRAGKLTKRGQCYHISDVS